MKQFYKRVFRMYDMYLMFMLLAYSGALVWQLWMPGMASEYSMWGSSIGWQREIALWNVGIIGAIVYAFIKKNQAYKKILTLQSTILCVVLGMNHTFSLLMNFSFTYVIHILGFFEVLLLGGGWGIAVLMLSKE